MSDRIPTAEQLLPLARLALALGRTERATLHEDGQTSETVAEHTVMLALVSFVVASRMGDVDPYLTAFYAVLHDLVEAIPGVGDTCTYRITEEERRAKKEREARGMVELRRQLAHFPELVLLLNAYEEQTIPETRVARYLDKVLPRLTLILNGCATVLAKGDSRADLERFHGGLVDRLGEQYPELVDQLEVILLEAMVRSEMAHPGPAQEPFEDSDRAEQVAIMLSQIETLFPRGAKANLIMVGPGAKIYILGQSTPEELRAALLRDALEDLGKTWQRYL